MADPEHLFKLQSKSDTWNKWRDENPHIIPDLSNLNFDPLRIPGWVNIVMGSSFNHTFDGFNFQNANLTGSNIHRQNIKGMELSGAILRECDLCGHDLTGMDFSNCDFADANLSRCLIREVNLENANITGANLEFAVIADSNLKNANLSNCRVYGASVWNSVFENSNQESLVIARPSEPELIVDNIRLAQFMYLIVNNQEIRDAIDTLTSKAVLILGRFTHERKPILDAIKKELRSIGYIPLLFDFNKPTTRNLTETIRTLAGLSKFVIADLTDPRSVPQELTSIIPIMPSVPIQPLIDEKQQPYDMFKDFQCYPWVLSTLLYSENTEKSLLVRRAIEAVEEYLRLHK